MLKGTYQDQNLIEFYKMLVKIWICSIKSIYGLIVFGNICVKRHIFKDDICKISLKVSTKRWTFTMDFGEREYSHLISIRWNIILSSKMPFFSEVELSYKNLCSIIIIFLDSSIEICGEFYSLHQYKWLCNIVFQTPEPARFNAWASAEQVCWTLCWKAGC